VTPIIERKGYAFPEEAPFQVRCFVSLSRNDENRDELPKPCDELGFPRGIVATNFRWRFRKAYFQLSHESAIHSPESDNFGSSVLFGHSRAKR
jgi:hypothetical protein